MMREAIEGHEFTVSGRIATTRADMEELEVLIGLILAATLLAALARRVGAPYPVFLALCGALLAFVPGAPTFTVLPELALALFVAPILLDAAYDASPRDLRDNWAPVTGLVVVGHGCRSLGGDSKCGTVAEPYLVGPRGNPRSFGFLSAGG